MVFNLILNRVFFLTNNSLELCIIFLKREFGSEQKGRIAQMQSAQAISAVNRFPGSCREKGKVVFFPFPL